MAGDEFASGRGLPGGHGFARILRKNMRLINILDAPESRLLPAGISHIGTNQSVECAQFHR